MLKNKLMQLYEKGALHITVGSFAIKFVAFFGSIVLVRLLSKEEYGLISYIDNIYGYTMLFAGLGLSNGLLRFLVRASNSIDKKRYFQYVIKRSFIYNILIVCILCILVQYTSLFDKYYGVDVLISIMVFALPFQDLYNDSLCSLRALFKNKIYAYLSLLISISWVISKIIGAYICGVYGVVFAGLIINFIAGILGVNYIKRLLIADSVSDLDRRQKKEINRYSFQYMITNGFWALFMLNDIFLLSWLQGDLITIAEYKVAYVIPGNLGILSASMGIFIGPYFTKNEKNISWVTKNYKVTFLINALVLCIVTSILAIFASDIIIFMYGESYANVYTLTQILLLASFFNSGLRYNTANILASMGQIKYNMIISGIGIILQIVLGIIMIPQYGAYGVAINSCIIYLFMAISLGIIFIKKYIFR